MLNMLLLVAQNFNSKTQLKPLKEPVVISRIFPFSLVEKGHPSFCFLSSAILSFPRYCAKHLEMQFPDLHLLDIESECTINRVII